MKNDISVKRICEFFWRIETNHNLFEWKEGGIYIWPLIRFKLYYLLTEKTGLFEKAHPFQATGFDKIKLLLKATYLLIFKNPIKFLSKKDYVLIKHPRKVNGIDLYSNALEQEIKKKTFIFDTIDEAFEKKYIVSLDAYKAWAYLLTYLMKPFKLYESKHPNLKIIESEIQKEFDVSIDLTGLYQDQYIKFKILKKVYRTIFSTIKPKKIFLVGAYFRQEIVGAAEIENIPVVELQHGVITKYHLGYSYPEAVKIPYFPNEIWCFGNYWHQSTPIPKDVSFKVIGAPYIYDLAKKVENTSQEKNRVLFTSQGVIGLELFDLAYKFAKKFKNYKVTFRLHPSENLNKYEGILKKIGSLSNFSISHKAPNIFELIKMNEVQVGVFSTTLFEGMVLGTKTVLIDLPGIEYMKPMIEQKKIECVASIDDLNEAILKAHLTYDSKIYYDTPIQEFDSIL